MLTMASARSALHRIPDRPIRSWNMFLPAPYPLPLPIGSLRTRYPW